MEININTDIFGNITKYFSNIKRHEWYSEYSIRFRFQPMEGNKVDLLVYSDSKLIERIPVEHIHDFQYYLEIDQELKRVKNEIEYITSRMKEIPNYILNREEAIKQWENSEFLAAFLSKRVQSEIDSLKHDIAHLKMESATHPDKLKDDQILLERLQKKVIKND